MTRPRIREAVQDAFDSYTRYWIEDLRLPSLSPRTINAGLRLVGFSNVTDALEGRENAVVKVRCPKCRALNDETAKFCNNCGAALAT